MDKRIDGRKYSNIVKEELKDKVSKLDIKPTLVVISVGCDEASKVYVHQKEKCAKYIGFNYYHYNYLDINELELLQIINKLNHDDKVDGIIVQLPLPKKYDTLKIINSIDPMKDVDGLTYINAGKLLNNEKCFVSCTPNGIMHLLKEENINLDGINAVVIGRSNLVGKPMFNLLVNANATVTLCHSHTKNLIDYTKNADLLIVAVGKKHLITKDMVKDGSIIIDVGINRDIDNKLYGDVAFDDVYDKVLKITPVPGGVGPMTVIMLMNNVFDSYLNKRSLN